MHCYSSENSRTILNSVPSRIELEGDHQEQHPNKKLKIMGDLPRSFDVPLPHKVESTIKSICQELNHQPPTPEVRQKLAAAGEEVAFMVVDRIRHSPRPFRNLSTLISHRLENESIDSQYQSFSTQSQEQLSRNSPFRSVPSYSASPATPSFPLSPSSATVVPPAAYSSPLSAAPRPSTSYSTPLSAAASASASPSSAVRRAPPLFPATSFNGGESSSSRTAYPRGFPSSRLGGASPSDVNRRLPFEDDESGGRINSNGREIILRILDQLEFRKLFLLLSYIGRRKLEEVLSPAAAHIIADMKDIPMTEFESHIWKKYGNHNLKQDESTSGKKKQDERIQYMDWDSGKAHLYYCDVYQDASYSFKGPYLTTSRTHLQRSLGDDNILIVKFIEEEIGDENIVSTEGILVGLRRYYFFVFKDESNVDKKKKDKKENDKASASRNKKCYFVHLDSVGLSGRNEGCPFSSPKIAEARGLFMHIHMVPNMAKYMARFSLVLSKTIRLPLDLSSVVIERIADIPCCDENGLIVLGEDDKPLILTDGTGFISEDLALLCPQGFGKAEYIKEEFQKFRHVIELTDMPYDGSCSEAWNREPPLLMQCRLFRKGLAVKGTLLLNRKLRKTIQIRPSMVKVESDENSRKQPVPQTFDSLEIVGTSQKPKRNYLSKNLIALLSYGGVPRKFFLDLLTSALDDTSRVFLDKRAAIKVSILHGEMDDDYTAARMISAGVPLDEPHLQDRLSKLANMERNKLKGGKLPISESFYLMGTVDPTGVLNSNEVCVILFVMGEEMHALETNQTWDIVHSPLSKLVIGCKRVFSPKLNSDGSLACISGKVLVYRNPALHFGDVHVMEAVYVKDLEEYIGNAKFGILFSTKGRRSAAAEMGNGDFDGDLYWVSRNPQLLSCFRASEPWVRMYSTPHSASKKPSDYSAEELEGELFRQFLRSRKPSLSMALAADSWISFMDQLLMLEENRCTEKDNLKRKILKLIDLYYDALDAPKSGKKVNIPPHLIAETYPHHMNRVGRSYKSSSVLGEIYDRTQWFDDKPPTEIEIWKLPFFTQCVENHPMEPFFDLWSGRYVDYRREMTEALKLGGELKNDAADDVIQKYKQMLYEAEDFYDSRKDSTQIYSEALAIYHLSYDYAIKVGDHKKCGFAWKIAGAALCKLLAFNQRQTPILIMPSVLREIL